MLVAYLVISPVVIKRRSRRRTSTAADLKMPPPPAKGFTPAASFVFDSPYKSMEVTRSKHSQIRSAGHEITFAGLCGDVYVYTGDV